jgi:predicted enzyme related to lactoylglutathione lyase
MAERGRSVDGTSIQTIYLTSGNPGALARFYRDVLGLSPRFADGERWIQFSDGKVNFAVAAPAEGVPGVRGPIVVFTASDVGLLAETIVAAGGKATGSRDTGPHGAVHTFEDPQGNAFQLFQPAPEPETPGDAR